MCSYGESVFQHFKKISDILSVLLGSIIHMTITIYVKTGCPWCKGALDFLTSHNMVYTEKNVTENPQFMEEMVSISGQRKAPTLVIDGEVLPDYSADELEVYFKNKGIL